MESRYLLRKYINITCGLHLSGDRTKTNKWLERDANACAHFLCINKFYFRCIISGVIWIFVTFTLLVPERKEHTARRGWNDLIAVTFLQNMHNGEPLFAPIDKNEPLLLFLKMWW